LVGDLLERLRRGIIGGRCGITGKRKIFLGLFGSVGAEYEGVEGEIRGSSD